MAWIISDNQIINTDFITLPQKPFDGDSPNMMWKLYGVSTLRSPLMIAPPLLGAFANASNLSQVSIPRSVKFIGKTAFRGTQLTSVTIASDCTYFDTSFPEGCAVNFYPD